MILNSTLPDRDHKSTGSKVDRGISIRDDGFETSRLVVQLRASGLPDMAKNLSAALKGPQPTLSHSILYDTIS